MTDNQEIADELARLYVIACGEWPDVSLELVDFVSYVTDRLPESRNASQLHTGDLCLACACSRGQTPALKAFVRERAPIIKTALGQLRGLGADTDDVVQLVLQKVLVADDGRSGFVRRTARDEEKKYARECDHPPDVQRVLRSLAGSGRPRRCAFHSRRPSRQSSA